MTEEEKHIKAIHDVLLETLGIDFKMPKEILKSSHIVPTTIVCPHCGKEISIKIENGEIKIE